MAEENKISWVYDLIFGLIGIIILSSPVLLFSYGLYLTDLGETSKENIWGKFFGAYMISLFICSSLIPEFNRLRRLYYILSMTALVVMMTIAFFIITELVPIYQHPIIIGFAFGSIVIMLRAMFETTQCRLLDINADSTFAFLLLVPIVNIIMILALMCIPGTHGDNQYGEDPRLKGIPKPKNADQTEN